MPWGAVVGAVVGAVAQDQAAKKGAKASQRATEASIAEQRRQYDQTRQDQLPFLNAAYGALDRQNAALNGDFSGFYQSPDYAFSFEQGMKALDRGAAARGAMFSGGADADRIKFGQGLASQNFNNYWDRLRGLTGQGQGSAQSLGSFGMGMAGNIGNALMANGQARASSYAAQGENWANLAQGLGNAFAYWNQSRKQPQGGSGWGYG